MTDVKNDQIKKMNIGGISLMPLSRVQWAKRMVDDCVDTKSDRDLPIFATSLNGHVLSKYHLSQRFRLIVDQADYIDADGMSIVFGSHLGRYALPERVATTDFFHDAAREASIHGLRFFFLGGTPEINDEAVQNVRRLYPNLTLEGHHGYINACEAQAVVDMIVGFKTHVLWIGMGVPLEHEFIVRNRSNLRGTIWLKTCGGLFDFLAERRSRAPTIIQKLGLEWSYRLVLEPKRLFWRYFVSNIHATFVIVAYAMNEAFRSFVSRK